MCFGTRFREIDKIIKKEKMEKKMITAHPANPQRRKGRGQKGTAGWSPTHECPGETTEQCYFGIQVTEGKRVASGCGGVESQQQ